MILWKAVSSGLNLLKPFPFVLIVQLKLCTAAPLKQTRTSKNVRRNGSGWLSRMRIGGRVM